MRDLPGNDPVQCMEWAKQVVGGKVPYDEAGLLALARDNTAGDWPRIAAIYSLGLVGSGDVAAPIRDLLANPGESEAVRSHAAEALGNLGDRGAARLLRDILNSEPEASLRESCEYALSEIGADS